MIKFLKYGIGTILFGVFSLYVMQFTAAWQPAPFLGFAIFLIIFSVGGGFIIHSYDQETSTNS